jgi:hypothetical protein
MAPAVFMMVDILVTWWFEEGEEKSKKAQDMPARLQARVKQRSTAP